jgi:tetratricopeptide (TPR) repeat protein
MASLAISAYEYFCKDIDQIQQGSKHKHQVEKMLYYINLAQSLLWCAKELLLEIGVRKNSKEYLQVLIHLTKYSAFFKEVILAKELFDECSDLINKTSMKEDDILIRRHKELVPCIAPGGDRKTTDKDKAILTFKSLIAIDVFFCDQHITFDISNFIKASKEKVVKFSLTAEETILVNKLFDNYCAVDLFRKKQYKESIPKFLSLIVSGHTDGVIFESLGDAYRKLGNYNQAINNFLKAFDKYTTTYAGERTFALFNKIESSLAKVSLTLPSLLNILKDIEKSYGELKEKIKNSSDKDKLFKVEVFLLMQYDNLGAKSKVINLVDICKESLRSIDTTPEEREQVYIRIEQIYKRNMPYIQNVTQRRMSTDVGHRK